MNELKRGPEGSCLQALAVGLPPVRVTWHSLSRRKGDAGHLPLRGWSASVRSRLSRAERLASRYSVNR